MQDVKAADVEDAELQEAIARSLQEASQGNKDTLCVAAPCQSSRNPQHQVGTAGCCSIHRNAL